MLQGWFWPEEKFGTVSVNMGREGGFGAYYRPLQRGCGIKGSIWGSRGQPLWIVIFMLLQITIHHEKSWWLLKHFLVFITFHDRSWSIMIYTEKSWKIMMVIETVMMYHELLWCIMNPYGKILKDFMNNREITWLIIICNITFWRGEPPEAVAILHLKLRPFLGYQDFNI